MLRAMASMAHGGRSIRANARAGNKRKIKMSVRTRFTRKFLRHSGGLMSEKVHTLVWMHS